MLIISAATGSVTAANSIGLSLTFDTTACADGVAIARTRSSLSPASFWAMDKLFVWSPCALL
ncbi:hypothetical protein D3C84_1088960 [compost metagenome]